MNVLPHLSIKTKIFLILVTFTTSFLILTNTIWVTRVRPLLLDSAIDTQQAEIETLSFKVRNFIDVKVRLLTLLSQSQVFLDQKTDLQISELQNSLKQDADILEIGVLDQFGQEISKVDREKTFKKEELVNKSGDLAYKTAFGFGKEYFSEVTFENNEPVMIIALPIVPTQITSNKTPAFVTQKGVIFAKIVLKNLNNALDNSGLGKEIFIVSANGLLISTAKGYPNNPINLSNTPLTPHITNMLQHVHSLRKVSSISDIDQEVYSTHITVEGLGWIVLVEEPTAQILAKVNQLATLAILIVIGGIVIAFILAQVTSRRLTKPIENLSYIADFIGKGDFTHRALIKTGDEFEQLGNAFNAMASLIQKQIDDLRKEDNLKDEFISLVSHNLRTPLTAIKGYRDLIEESKSLNQNDKLLLSKLSINVNVLERLVEEVLSISSIGPKGIRLNLQKTNLESLIKEAIHEVELQSQKKNINIESHLSNNIPTINIDLHKLQDVLVNLLDNAIKFSTEHSKIEVTVDYKDDHLFVSVRDYGVGIDAQEIPKLFQKFHRAVDYLTYNYKGNGLGLYFSKLVIESHGGKIWVDSTKGKGSTFSFTLPLTPPNKSM